MRSLAHSLLMLLAIVAATLHLSRDSAVASVAATAQPRSLDEGLEILRKQHDLPAVAAIVIQEGDVVAEGAAGIRRLGVNNVLVTTNDRWHIGSCTKSMTATLIAVLVEQGDLRWDQSLGESLPEFELDTSYTDVTLRELVAHRSGIPSEWKDRTLWGRLWENRRDLQPVEQRAFLTEYLLTRPAGGERGEYLYSNSNFAIAGHIAERVAQVPWEELMRRHVFAPLQMDSAGFGVPWSDRSVIEPWPHDASRTPRTPGPMADNPPAIAPGGAVHLQMRDWAKYISAHIAGHRGLDRFGAELLSPEGWRELHTPMTGHGHSYGGGWIVTRRGWAAGPGGTGIVLTHNGSNNSWFAVAWVAPEIDYAILVATNVGGDGVRESIDAIVGEVLKTTQASP